MLIRLKDSPIAPPCLTMRLTRDMTVSDILHMAEAPSWFMSHGVVRLGGHVIPADRWSRVVVKSGADSVLELCTVQHNDKVWTALATIATIALVTAVSGGLLAPLLGSSFAAGGLGASLAAAGVGIAGQLAVSAMTAPPVMAAADSGRGRAGRPLSQAGISGNSIELNGVLPLIQGKIGMSPMIIAPPYTTFDDKRLTVNAVFGVQGRCQVGNVLINGVDPTTFDGAVVETREGYPGEPGRTICLDTVIEQTPSLTLTKFTCRGFKDNSDPLTNQDTPANSISKWHVFRTDGVADEVRIRGVVSGLAVSDVDADAALPIRIEARRVGDTDWRQFPTLHIYDRSRGRSPIRFDLAFKFRDAERGRHVANGYPGLDCYLLDSRTALGTSFQYMSDAYFYDTTLSAGFIPAMTGPTFGGYTFSATSAAAGQPAWFAGDQDTATYWQTANNSLPASLKVETNVPITARSYGVIWGIGASPLTTCGTYWLLWGSFDNVNWTELDRVDVRGGGAKNFYYGQIEGSAAYSYYRLEVYQNNGAANQVVTVSEFRLYSAPVYGTQSSDGNAVAESTNCAVSRNGATFWLDPNYYLPALAWPTGEYEFRIKRGWAYRVGQLDATTYDYAGSNTNSYFFTYATVGGDSVIYESANRFSGDVAIEAFQTISHDPPFDPEGIALIAVQLPDTAISTVYAEFTRYARTWDGSVWSEDETPTANPAALYRNLLLGGGNPDPVPGELIDEDSLVAWYNRCVAAGHECNAVTHGALVGDVLQLIASAGYGDPRMANVWGVVEDYDTSAQPMVDMLLPNNSRDLGTEILLPRIPHAIRASYADATNFYKEAFVMVYRDGFDAQTAVEIEEQNYPGLTATAQVQARALFDMRQFVFRANSYHREVGPEGFALTPGQVVGITDDLIDFAQGFGRIVSVQGGGGFITGITTDNILPFAAGQGDVWTSADLTASGDITVLSQAMAVAIRRDDATVQTILVTATADSRTIVFATPVVDDGWIVPDLIVCSGMASKVVRRTKVLHIEPATPETWRIMLVDEAPQLFA